MNKRMVWFLALILIFPLIASACGGDDISTDDAEKAIRAGFEGDFEEANKYICEAEQVESSDAQAMPEGAEIDVSCEKDGDNMKCSVSGSIPMGEGVDPITLDEDVTFSIEDGKLCGEVN